MDKIFTIHSNQDLINSIDSFISNIFEKNLISTKKKNVVQKRI